MGCVWVRGCVCACVSCARPPPSPSPCSVNGANPKHLRTHLDRWPLMRGGYLVKARGKGRAGEVGRNEGCGEAEVRRSRNARRQERQDAGHGITPHQFPTHRTTFVESASLQLLWSSTLLDLVYFSINSFLTCTNVQKKLPRRTKRQKGAL